MRVTHLIIIFSCFALIGAGCALPRSQEVSKEPQAAQPAGLEPAPAQKPLSEPVIPPEAKNVPLPEVRY